MQDHRWQRVNAIGAWVETALARIVAVALLVVTLVLLLRIEWALLPEAARDEVVCGEELTAIGARSLVYEELKVPAPNHEDDTLLEQCREVAAEQHEGGGVSDHGGWWVPLAFIEGTEGEP